jgi:hypothetical protein
MELVNTTIRKLAESYVGQQEVPGNEGWYDKRFQELMEATGWEFGQAYCAYFCELIWRQAYARYNSVLGYEVEKLFSGGAMRTWNNFSKSDYQTDNKPATGAVVIWQNYKAGRPHWTGHAGIVTKVDEAYFHTVEGNTNSSGGREGVEVAEKLRPLDFEKKEYGLVLKGFIHPKH